MNYLQWSKHYPCTRQIIINFCGQSKVVSYPTPESKPKMYSCNISVGFFLLRNKNSYYKNSKNSFRSTAVFCGRQLYNSEIFHDRKSQKMQDSSLTTLGTIMVTCNQYITCISYSPSRMGSFFWNLTHNLCFICRCIKHDNTSIYISVHVCMGLCIVKL